MFTGQIIAVAFFLMFASFGPANLLKIKNRDKLANLFFAIGLVASIYSLISGVHLLGGWEDPFSDIDTSTASSSRSFTSEAKQQATFALVKLVSKFWPYFLIGAGGLLGCTYATILWQRR